MTEKDLTGKVLERRVADAYRRMGATKVEHDVELAGNQIDVYVELPAPGQSLLCIAVEVKDYERPVGIRIVNDFAQIVDLLYRRRLVHQGVLVGASGFSKPARNAAKEYGIRLLEPDDLEAMAAEVHAPRPIAPSDTLVAETEAAQDAPLPALATHERLPAADTAPGSSSDVEPSKQLIGLGEDRPSESVWKVKVFDFRNFSRGMEEERIGERFSEYILDSLIKLDLNAGGIANPRYSLSRSGNPEYETIIWKEYAEYAPLIAVVGHVSPIDDDRFEAGIRVATLRSTWAYYPDVVMVEEVVCSNQPAKMKEVAHMLAERIRDTIQEIMSTPLQEDRLSATRRRLSRRSGLSS